MHTRVRVALGFFTLSVPHGVAATTYAIGSIRTQIMAADINLQVWLETDAAAHPPIVTPYVQSAVSQRIQYQLQMTMQGRSGSSRVGQGGSVLAPAGQATALSQLSISVGQGIACQIELTLSSDSMDSSSYHFDCPR